MKLSSIGLLIVLVNLIRHINSDGNSLNESKESGTTERILSRKKRHLIFPEGSSVQLAFDYLIPTYGVPKLFVIGMSFALAWELPSEPFRTYHVGRPAERPDGAGGDGADGDTTEQPDNGEGDAAKDELMHDKYYGGWNKAGAGWLNDRKDTRRPLISMKWPYTKNAYNKFYPANNANYYSDKYNKPYYGAVRPQRPREQPPAKRRIYPVFTKRSINDDDELQHHRRTRRDLYTKIARLFSTQGKNGQQCVLKALCEAGKRRHEEPGEFLDEILKTIFSIPNYADMRETSEYDEAHYSEDDCDDKYSACTNSIFTDSMQEFAMK